MPTTQSPTQTTPAGRSIRAFCAETGISESWFHELTKRCPERLDVIKVFGKSVVMTTPRDFLEGFRTNTNTEAAQ